MTHVLHAGLDLLDRQIVDADDELVGKVDDLDFTDPDEGDSPKLTALLLGPEAYGRRLGGRVGSWVAATAKRLGRADEPIRIPVDLIDDLGTSIKLNVRLSDLERVERVDHWLRDHFIGRIPGADHASE